MATPGAPRRVTVKQLREELLRAYGHLSEITGRLLLVNEAADATLSSHDRVDLCERFLGVLASGLEVRRAGVFLVEGDGSLSVGGTVGLDEAERDALVSSDDDIVACQTALESQQLFVADPELMATDAAEEELESELDGELVDESGAPLDDEATIEIEGGEDAAGDEENEEDEADGGDDAEDDAGDADGGGEDAGAAEGPCFGLYLPVLLDGTPTAVLGLGARARSQAYSADDVVLLEYLLRQFAVAVHRSLLLEHNAERLGELDALLKVSREITSTLDLDAVLRAVVNTVSAVVENDRAEIALVEGARLKLRAVSGITRLAPDQAELFQLEHPFEYLVLEPKRFQLSADDLAAEPPPPGARVFTEYFERQEMRSFMALPLKDDQGLLGVLCLESRQDSWDVEPAEGDALEIVAAQTTVAIRNATLYGQIPLRGFARPMLRMQQQGRAMGSGRRRLLIGAALAALLAMVLPWVPLRAGGPAEVRARHSVGVRPMSEGIVVEVMATGGEEVQAGQPLARIEDLELAARLSDLRAGIEVARREAAVARAQGDDAAWREAQIRLGSLERSRSYEERRALGTVLAAPFAGQVLELDLAQRVGQHLEIGQSFCTVAALDTVEVALSIAEERVGRVRLGDPVSIKMLAYPTRTWRGHVSEVGWRGEPDARGIARFTVRAAIANPDRALRPGMTGVGRAVVGRTTLMRSLLDPIVRGVQMGWW